MPRRWARTAVWIAAISVARCGAGQRPASSPAILAHPRAADAGLVTASRWEVVAVPLVQTQDTLHAIDAGDGVARWTFGPLRVTLDGDQLVAVGEPPRSAIVASAPLAGDGGWLFVTEDGAAWTAQTFDGPLRRLAREAATRVRALSAQSFDAIALESPDHSVLFASRAGVLRAPDTIVGPPLAASFVSQDRGYVIEQPGRVFEITSAGRSARPLSIGQDAALDLAIGPNAALVRTARGWLALAPSGQWTAHPGPPANVHASANAADLAQSVAVSAVLEPTRGRAFALSLGAVALEDRTVALVDRSHGGELVFLRPDASTQRVDGPCAQGVLHPFGAQLVVECGHEDSHLARYFVGDQRGFRPLGGERNDLGERSPSTVHIAADGSGVIIEQPCQQRRDDPRDEESDSVFCVLDHGHSPRSVTVAPLTRVRQIRAGRALLAGHARSGQIAELFVANLSSLDEPAIVEHGWQWRHPTLSPDGSVIATALRGAQRMLVRASPAQTAQWNALPPHVTRVHAADAERFVAFSRAPAALWMSEDRGRTWSQRPLNIDGASSVHSDEPPAEARYGADFLGRNPAHIDGACTAYACVFDDGIIVADPSWLRAPPLAAAREASDTLVDPAREARRGPIDAVWFCGDVTQQRALSPTGAVVRSAAAPTASAGDQRWGGAPGSSGWLAIDERSGTARARWIAAEQARVTQHASVFSTLAPLVDNNAAVRSAPSSTDYQLRLATRAFAIIERCAPSGECDVLFARAQGPLRALLSARAQLSSSTWTGRLQLAEPLPDGGFALWFARVETSASTTLLSLAQGSADAVLSFDREGAPRERRSFAWAEGQCSTRALALDAGELGLVCVHNEEPSRLRFFSISSGLERSITADFSASSGACVERANERSWLVTGSAGWAPLVYARGRAAAFEFGVRARWALRASGPCLSELRVDSPPGSFASPLQASLQTSLRVRPTPEDPRRLHADFIGRTSIERASCTQR